MQSKSEYNPFLRKRRGFVTYISEQKKATKNCDWSSFPKQLRIQSTLVGTILSHRIKLGGRVLQNYEANFFKLSKLRKLGKLFLLTVKVGSFVRGILFSELSPHKKMSRILSG